jgi:hypothetical protein
MKQLSSMSEKYREFFTALESRVTQLLPILSSMLQTVINVNQSKNGLFALVF